MIETSLSPEALALLMEECGFVLQVKSADLVGEFPIPVFHPDCYLTIASEIDPTVKDMFLRNYLVLCSEAYDFIRRIDPCAADQWIGTANRAAQTGLYAFLSGSGSWLLSRLLLRSELTIWATEVDHEDYPEQGNGMGESRERRRHAIKIEGLNRESIVSLCAGMIQTAGEEYSDYWVFLADSGELYCIHHHDKVNLVVPKHLCERLKKVTAEAAQYSFVKRIYT
jgi:hypothetical protein